MYIVYILYSEKYNKTYVGFTSDLKGRLQAHNHSSNTGWTKRYAPWICIYDEAFPVKREAMNKEKWLKSGVGRNWMKNNLF